MSSAPANAQATTNPGQLPGDCLPCKLTGAAAFSGLGIYALNIARQDGAFQKVRPKGGSFVGSRMTAGLGIVFLALGMGRLAM